MVKNSVKIFTIQQTNGKHTLYPDRKRAAYLLITALILRGFFFLGGIFTETRVAVIGIIVENRDSAAELNAVLSEYGDYIIGRMGVPYHKKNINIISVAVDAPQDVINTLGGKIGRLSGVSTKTAYANV